MTYRWDFLSTKWPRLLYILRLTEPFQASPLLYTDVFHWIFSFDCVDTWTKWQTLKKKRETDSYKERDPWFESRKVHHNTHLQGNSWTFWGPWGLLWKTGVRQRQLVAGEDMKYVVTCYAYPRLWGGLRPAGTKTKDDFVWESKSLRLRLRPRLTLDAALIGS